MIVLDPADSQDLPPRVSFDSISYPEKAATSTSYSRLPDYETSQAAQERRVSTQQSPTKRPWYWLSPKWRRAVICVLSLYIVVTLAVTVPLVLKKKRESQGTFNPPMQAAMFGGNDTATILRVLADSHCSNTSVPTNVLTLNSNHTFTVIGGLSVYASECDGGDRLSATFTAISNPDESEPGIIISLAFGTASTALREQINYCFLDHGMDRGVWLQLPGQLTSTDRLTVNIQLLLPFQRSGQTLQLDQLTTSLPFFTQDFTDLRSFIFNNIQVGGLASNISSQFLLAHQIHVKTTRGDITGNFMASDVLDLETLGSPIRGNLTIGPGALTGSLPAQLNVITGNSEIDVEINMLIPPQNSQKFLQAISMTLETFNAPITANVVTSPPATADSKPSQFDLTVHNNVGLTNITVDADLDMTFDLNSKLSPVSIIESNTTGYHVNYTTKLPTSVAAWSVIPTGSEIGSGIVCADSILGEIVVRIKNYP